MKDYQKNRAWLRPKVQTLATMIPYYLQDSGEYMGILDHGNKSFTSIFLDLRDLVRENSIFELCAGLKFPNGDFIFEGDRVQAINEDIEGGVKGMTAEIKFKIDSLVGHTGKAQDWSIHWISKHCKKIGTIHD